MKPIQPYKLKPQTVSFLAGRQEKCAYNPSLTNEEKKAIFKTLDEAMVKNILESIIDQGPGIHWSCIMGLKNVK